MAGLHALLFHLRDKQPYLCSRLKDWLEQDYAEGLRAQKASVSEPLLN